MPGRTERRDRQPEDVRCARAFDGARLTYEVTGNGPPLVMLHGVLTGRASFSRQRAALSEHHQLVLPSARGHDGSEWRLPTNYGVGTSDVDDLCAVLDTERFNRVSLIGHSSGGATAFVFACRYPERVSRIVLIEPTLFDLLPDATREAVVRPTLAIADIADTDGPEAGLRAFLALTAGEAWNRLDAGAQARRLRALASCASVLGPHLRGVCRTTVTEADVAGLRAPALLLYGARSFRFEPAIANGFRAQRPDLRVVTIERAGHNVHRDRPDIVNPEIAAFLAA